MIEADAETILERGREAFPGGDAAHHLRQWAAIRGPRLQGVHSPLWDGPCAHVALLPIEQRQGRKLAQDGQTGVYSPVETDSAGQDPYHASFRPLIGGRARVCDGPAICP